MKLSKKQEYIRRVKENVDFNYELASDLHTITTKYFDYVNENLENYKQSKLNDKQKDFFLNASAHLHNLVSIILPLCLSFKSCYEQVCLISDIENTFDDESAHDKLFATETCIYNLIYIANITSPIEFPDKFKGVWFYGPLHNEL